MRRDPPTPPSTPTPRGKFEDPPPLAKNHCALLARVRERLVDAENLATEDDALPVALIRATPP
eukprot:8382025-Pyramimonas_sp.AAC.1